MSNEQPRPPAYTLTLTTEDLRAIAFAGNRYAWSDALSALEEGTNGLTESAAWAIHDAIEQDMEGGHDAFPLLNPRSELAAKLAALYEEVV